MSYVLDALRRAESERQRGSVPSLHAQSHVAPDLREAAPSVARGRWVVAGLIGLLVVAAAVWWGWATPNVAPPTSAVVTTPTFPLAAPPPSPSAAPPLRPLPAPAPAARSLAVPPAARPLAAAPQTPSPASAAPVPASTAMAAAAGRVPRLQDLPEPLRRQVPALVFGGATDSPEPSARMLIINGQVWREGDELASGLTLERIALRSAVFRVRDQRFEVTY